MFKQLFKQTFIYGLATVLPRMFSFILVPLYTAVLPVDEYGQLSVIYAFFIIFNILLSYGMETAFFRFYAHTAGKATDEKSLKQRVLSTGSWSLLVSSGLFFLLGWLSKGFIADVSLIPEHYIAMGLAILVLDALVVLPFAHLRAQGKPMRYAVIKVLNVLINLLLNLFFLVYLEPWSKNNAFLQSMYVPDFEISYVLIANVVTSAATLLFMFPFYTKLRFIFDKILWKKMLRYSFPVLIAGVAFSINTSLDKILLDYLLPESIAESQIGIYAACYKLAIFMTLFATAFRLGIEPFFFSHASAKNAKKTYAAITQYFVIFGAFIFVGVVVYIDFLKNFIISDSAYWGGMRIVPLVLLANFFLGIYHNLSVWYKITDKTKYGAYISCAGALLTIVLNVVLIPYYGYFGSAIALLAAYGSMVLLSYYYGQKHYPIPYNLKKIGGYLGLSVVISVISFYFFRENHTVGTVLLLLFALVVFKQEKKQVQHILKK